MSIETDLKEKLRHNQRMVYICEADELFAAWQFRRNNTFTRSVSFSRCPTEYRCSAPPREDSQVMPCLVSHDRKTGKLNIKPETTQVCHGHGQLKRISFDDPLFFDAVQFAKRNVAPFISPILDAATLALLAKDFGFYGRAIPKIIRGRQYIAFSGYSGLRSMFSGTMYRANNKKIIKMGIGSLGVKNMVQTGGIVTFCITVPLVILEHFLRDSFNTSALFGDLANEVLKIGIGVIASAIAGLLLGKAAAFVAAPVAVVVVISLMTTYALGDADLITKIAKGLEEIAKKMENTGKEAQRKTAIGFDGFFRGQGLNIPRF